MKIKVIKTAIASATTIDHQIPFPPQTRGKTITAATWKTSVLKNEIIAEIGPLFSAVKNDEPYIAKPEKINEKEQTRNACLVSSKTSKSLETNMDAIG